MNTVRLKISPPWITMINKIQALFDGDPEIACNVDWDAPSITLACNNGDKVAALQQILPSFLVYVYHQYLPQIVLCVPFIFSFHLFVLSLQE